MTTLDMQPGAQTLASESSADVILMGSGAGVGKTRWLVHNMAEYYDKPGYGAVIFRRTSPELRGQGSIWAETQEIYPLLGGEPVESRLTWKFPSGAQVQLSHLQHEKDVAAWQGKQLCAVGFDEATHFSEQQFWFLLSRLRSPHGIRTRFRMTCNPDPDSYLLDWVRWYLDKDGFPDPKKSGVVRWFARVGGKLMWFDQREDAPESAMSFAFVPGNLDENLALMRNDPTYRQKLLALPPVEQARYLSGNWYARAARGELFQSAWFPHVPTSRIERVSRGFDAHIEGKVRARWRSWDLAGTPVDGRRVVGAPKEVSAEASRPDADWTCSWLFCQLEDGRVYLADHTRHQDTPGAIEWLIRRTAERDGHSTTQVLWKDPAQAGKHQEVILRRLLGSYRVATHPSFDPMLVARTASREAFAGRLLVPEDAPWLREVMTELEGFPLAAHDDSVSALGLGCCYWLEMRDGRGPTHGLAPAGERQPGFFERERDTSTQRVGSKWRDM